MLPVLRQASGRRAFSMISTLRTIARAAEPHPFARLPLTQTPAKPDWGRQIRHVGDAAKFFFPGMALFLVWPILAEKAINGHV